MEMVELKAKPRKATGKNNARQLRAAGLVPVNVYGHNQEAANLTVQSRDFEAIMRGHSGSSFIMKLQVDGSDETSVIIKEIQRHPIRDELLHIDLLSVSLDEKIVTGVPVHLIGDPQGVLQDGGVLQGGIREVQIEALPTDLPEFIEIDVSSLELTQTMHIGEITLPSSLVLISSPDDVVATILEPTKLVEPEVVTALGAEEEGAEGAEAESAEEAGS